jgi:hypothetical protein
MLSLLKFYLHSSPINGLDVAEGLTGAPVPRDECEKAVETPLLRYFTGDQDLLRGSLWPATIAIANFT